MAANTTNELCFLTRTRSRDAALMDGGHVNTSSGPAPSKPWSVPPDMANKDKLTSVLHDPNLPIRMLSHLAELMRADPSRFNNEPSLQRAQNQSESLKASISRVPFKVRKEPITSLVTSRILVFVEQMVDESGLGNLTSNPQTSGDGVKETEYILDWHLEGDGDVSVCWEDKPQATFDTCIGAIINDAKACKAYPESLWADKVTNSTHSTLGRVSFIVGSMKIS